jgi:hypothetical protein
MDKVQRPGYSRRNRMEHAVPPWRLSAGIVALVLDLAHIFRSAREIHGPMVGSDWPEPAKAVCSVVWHAATAMMALGGLALIAAGLMPDRALELAALPAPLFLSGALLFLVYGVKRLGSVWILPHWIAFLAIPALAVVGLAGDACTGRWPFCCRCSLRCTSKITWQGCQGRRRTAQCRRRSAAPTGIP